MDLKRIDRRAIEQTFKEIDRVVEGKGLGSVNLILCGSAALIVKHDFKRSTRDIDVIATSQRPVFGIGALLARHGFHLVPEALLCLHPDYANRLQEVVVLKRLKVYALGSYDLAISKIAEDRQDLFISGLAERLDLQRLRELYFEAMKYWVGREEEFVTNWKLFEEEWHERKGPSWTPPRPG